MGHDETGPGPADGAHTVTAADAGQTLAKIVRGLSGEVPWSQARRLCSAGKVTRNGEAATDASVRVAAGDRIIINPTAKRIRRGVLPDEAIVYVDRQVVVVNKPAGVMSVPFEETDRDTLVDQTRAALRSKSRGGSGQGPDLGVVQRLDKDTTGVLVFSRTLAAKKHLQQQFRAHTIIRRYVALVHGTPAEGVHDSVLLQDRGDGLRGSHGHFRRPRGNPPADARQAITRVRCLERLGAATLVECRLETGRQHQIRIHLSEDGCPLVGERVYIRDFEGTPIRARRPMLHAQTLGFEHPVTGEALLFEQPPPADFTKILEALRRTAQPTR